LWVSLVVFSASIGILMNLITGIYEEGQERRQRLAELAKYMSWRVLPRQMRGSLRRYLNFVWDCSEKIGDIENQVMDKLSPTLRSKLCVHIFGGVLTQCPFLTWMHHDREAMKKLCIRMKSEFLEANDLLFSYGEISHTVYILVNGWVTLCIGSDFDLDDNDADLSGNTGIARAGNTFDNPVMKALKRATTNQVTQNFTVANNYNFSLEADKKVSRDYAYIPAPAFFAESLLFQSEPTPSPYSAQCLTRAEFATFSLEDVDAVLEALPNLRKRFDDFSKQVNANGIARRQSLGSGDGPKSTPAAPTDLPRTSPASPITRAWEEPSDTDGEGLGEKRPTSKKKVRAKNAARPISPKPTAKSPSPKAKKAKAAVVHPEDPQ
jgi:CRP-like cAMP-binding protein